MAQAQKRKYSLVFTENPPACDIATLDEFRDDGGFEIGTVRKVKKPSWKIPLNAKVLRTSGKTASFFLLLCFRIFIYEKTNMIVRFYC